MCVFQIIEVYLAIPQLFYFEYIFVSAGQRGMQIKLNPKDLIGFLKLNVDDLIL